MKINKETLVKWTKMVDDWMSKNAGILDPYGIRTRDHVVDGASAWTLVRRSGVLDEAYQDRSVVDAHIQTAMETIFPNVRFRDKKVY